MQIFIDADAFPNVIRDILIKASLTFEYSPDLYGQQTVKSK